MRVCLAIDLVLPSLRFGDDARRSALGGVVGGCRPRSEGGTRTGRDGRPFLGRISSLAGTGLRLAWCDPTLCSRNNGLFAIGTRSGQGQRKRRQNEAAIAPVGIYRLRCSCGGLLPLRRRYAAFDREGDAVGARNAEARGIASDLGRTRCVSDRRKTKFEGCGDIPGLRRSAARQ